MTGIGVSIVVLQVPPLLGWPMDLGNSVVGTVLEWPELFRSVNLEALAVGAVTVGATVCTAMLLIGAVFSIGQWASLVPHAVLAAVLCKAGFDLVDGRFMSRLRHVQREHLVIAMVTLAITLCFDLITAVAFGFVTAALAGARQLERLELDRVVSTPLLDQAFLGSGGDEFTARVGLVQLRGSFTAASARKLIRIVASDIKHHEVVILDFSQTDYIDDSAALVVEHMIYTANTENTAVIIVGLRDSVAQSLTGFGILRDVPSQHRVATIDQARELARTMLEDNSTGHDTEPDQPLTGIPNT